jgi:integrase
MSRRSGQSGCIRKDGKWFVVRFWKDVEGQEKRQRVREKICPISGPGKLSVSERKHKTKEIIAASGADTVEHFEKTVESNHGITSREQATIWLDRIRNRQRKPVALATLEMWECALDNWVLPNIGDMPLESVNNLAMKELVATMRKGDLSPKSILNYAQVVKMVVASAINEEGDRIIARTWNHDFIDMPMVDKRQQNRPDFTGDVVTRIIAATRKEKYRVLFALCAASGLRFGEALGIDIKDVSEDCVTIQIEQKAWRGKVEKRLKTENATRAVDLHSSVAQMLKAFIGERTGLLFAPRTGKPLQQSNVLRRTLHPILEKLGQPKCGVHAFRRFRNTFLRNHTAVTPGLYKFWMGHAGEDMSDLYDMIRRDHKFRRERAEQAGIGFEIPSSPIQAWHENCSFGPNGLKTEVAEGEEVALSC